jgi:hypothetical protein
MLLPALGKARDKADTARSISNLKQIYFMVRMYVDDYDGYWPKPMGNLPNPNGNRILARGGAISGNTAMAPSPRTRSAT